MKIAYISPFAPEKSGIADFAGEVAAELRKLCDIDIYSNVPVADADISASFKCYNVSDIYNDKLREKYDFLLYQIGNNYKYHKKISDAYFKFPSVLELHDVSLCNFIYEATVGEGNLPEYARIMKYCHGELGVFLARDFLLKQNLDLFKTAPLDFALNKHYIAAARAVIVHSDFARMSVETLRPSVSVINIPHHTAELRSDFLDYKKKCKQALGTDKAVIGSFGDATVKKRIVSILHALERYKKYKNGDFIYYIVGKLDIPGLADIIQKLGLTDNVKVTGYASHEQFLEYMGSCDFIFNLRYPTHGETSGSLHRAVGLGKPAVVTAVGSFLEYDDGFTIKVRYDEHETDDIYNAVVALLEDGNELEVRSSAAYEYAAANFSLAGNAKKYYEFLQKLRV